MIRVKVRGVAPCPLGRDAQGRLPPDEAPSAAPLMMVIAQAPAPPPDGLC